MELYVHLHTLPQDGLAGTSTLGGGDDCCQCQAWQQQNRSSVSQHGDCTWFVADGLYLHVYLHTHTHTNTVRTLDLGAFTLPLASMK